MIICFFIAKLFTFLYQRYIFLLQDTSSSAPLLVSSGSLMYRNDQHAEGFSYFVVGGHHEVLEDQFVIANPINGCRPTRSQLNQPFAGTSYSNGGGDFDYVTVNSWRASLERDRRSQSPSLSPAVEGDFVISRGLSGDRRSSSSIVSISGARPNRQQESPERVDVLMSQRELSRERQRSPWRQIVTPALPPPMSNDTSPKSTAGTVGISVLLKQRSIRDKDRNCHPTGGESTSVIACECAVVEKGEPAVADLLEPVSIEVPSANDVAPASVPCDAVVNSPHDSDAIVPQDSVHDSHDPRTLLMSPISPQCDAVTDAEMPVPLILDPLPTLPLLSSSDVVAHIDDVPEEHKTETATSYSLPPLSPPRRRSRQNDSKPLEAERLDGTETLAASSCTPLPVCGERLVPLPKLRFQGTPSSQPLHLTELQCGLAKLLAVPPMDILVELGEFDEDRCFVYFSLMKPRELRCAVMADGVSLEASDELGTVERCRSALDKTIELMQLLQSEPFHLRGALGFDSIVPPPSAEVKQLLTLLDSPSKLSNGDYKGNVLVALKWVFGSLAVMSAALAVAQNTQPLVARI